MQVIVTAECCLACGQIGSEHRQRALEGADASKDARISRSLPSAGRAGAKSGQVSAQRAP